MARHQLVRGTRLQQSDWLAVGGVSVGFLVLWGTAYGVHGHLPDWAQGWYVDTSMLSTLLQVIPSVIVAVFIFAAGTVFVIAQMILSTLGSRSVLSLVRQDAARAGVIAGMILLVVSLLLTTVATTPPDDSADEVDLFTSSAGVALSLTTSLYVIAAMRVIVGVVWTFVDPMAYSQSLSRPLRHSRWNARGQDSEEFYERLRTLRQWLRTAAISGESRDITHALAGMDGLLGQYLAGMASYPTWRHVTPKEYELAEDGVVGDADRPYLYGWLGNEVGRAVVRGLEVGMRGNLLLRRDADELLSALVRAVRQCAEKGAHEEAGFLLDRIAEIGLFRLQISDPIWDRWFDAPVRALAELEKNLEDPYRKVLPPRLRLQWYTPKADEPPPTAEAPEDRRFALAARALAAWSLACQALEQCRGAHAGDLGALGQTFEKNLGKLAKGACQHSDDLWNDARALACDPQILPRWLPGDHTSEDGVSTPTELDADISAYLMAVRSQVRTRPDLAVNGLSHVSPTP